MGDTRQSAERARAASPSSGDVPRPRAAVGVGGVSSAGSDFYAEPVRIGWSSPGMERELAGCRRIGRRISSGARAFSVAANRAGSGTGLASVVGGRLVVIGSRQKPGKNRPGMVVGIQRRDRAGLVRRPQCLMDPGWRRGRAGSGLDIADSRRASGYNRTVRCPRASAIRQATRLRGTLPARVS